MIGPRNIRPSISLSESSDRIKCYGFQLIPSLILKLPGSIQGLELWPRDLNRIFGSTRFERNRRNQEQFSELWWSFLLFHIIQCSCKVNPCLMQLLPFIESPCHVRSRRWSRALICLLDTKRTSFPFSSEQNPRPVFQISDSWRSAIIDAEEEFAMARLAGRIACVLLQRPEDRQAWKKPPRAQLFDNTCECNNSHS